MDRSVTDLLLHNYSRLSTLTFIDFISICQKLRDGEEINSDVLRWVCSGAILAVETHDAYVRLSMGGLR